MKKGESCTRHGIVGALRSTKAALCTRKQLEIWKGDLLYKNQSQIQFVITKELQFFISAKPSGLTTEVHITLPGTG